jgi:hypothetical protein
MAVYKSSPQRWEGLRQTVVPESTTKDRGLVVDKPAGEEPGVDPVDRSVCGEDGNRVPGAYPPANQVSYGKGIVSR